MPLLKRKPVHMHPLPSLSAIVQPINTAQAESSPSASAPGSESTDQHLKDSNDDEAQLSKLISVLHDPTLSAPVPKRPRASLQANGAPPNGAGQPPPGHGSLVPGYRVKNVDCFYLPETGEIFLDYETFALRRAFYDQQVFQCEVTGKSALSYFDALYNEQREVKQLHARFPRPLKKAVLQSVHFQVEGKLDTLADKVHDRFLNRFFNDEKVFVDVQGDKYLARVVKTFPPKDLNPPPGGSPCHPYAMDLNLEPDDVIELDDPMKYFYQVRLIEEGGEGDRNGSPHEREGDEKWGGSVMEVQADKISRDRINYSRAMLKRFIRDCVGREAAIYSPWIVKKPIAMRYGLPTEMTDELRAVITAHREAQMERRKRDRDERLGITHDGEETEHEQPAKKKRSSKGLSKEDRDRIKQEEQEAEEKAKEQEEVKKKTSRGIKYPIEDFLLEYQEKDKQAGRIEVKPVPNRDLPFGEHFEKFLMVWSFLNVMGKPLGISSFTIDDFEQSLYHNDQWSTAPPLLVEIHAVLVKALSNDLKAGNEPVRSLLYTGMVPENDIDYWEGTKGATAETLRPVVAPMADAWTRKELSHREGRKGWEQALIGCLWDRATLEVFPSYLDLILFLTFENKPAPTRPTWSTGPSHNNATGLIPAKPEKRYNLLHFTQKLDIIDFLIELVAQTGVVRDFMEEATSELTEVRKKQQEVRREHKRVRAEREALEPKEEKKDDEDGEQEEGAESRLHSPNGIANGTATNTERDELDSAAGDDNPSRFSSPMPERNTGASRRRAMRERAAEREAEEAMKAAAAAKERQEVKAARAEARQLALDRKRLEDEEAALEAKLHEIERDFRRHLYTLRARPLGVDRWHNRVWWLDGGGSAPLLNDGKVVWGTGRLYIQGADELDIELSRQGLPHVTQGLGVEIPASALAEKRAHEEGEAKLAPGEWAVYDTPEQLKSFYDWLNPRGRRDLDLQRTLKMWWTELEGGFHRRRIQTGLEAVPEEPAQRRTRRVAGEEEREGYLGWKNKRAGK
ncbi:hypothetical protein CC85DRAFT_92470 [Cutaneotrichosporon oleaginosum]|uniref:WAC domain-containing protein n=1 Tax=Cutaneotrichosporon oleaginosum TaxID=879819 RepID=A0A0J0XMP0_9TREE|nr:uncharacterized protein CC85DRAFT_92470 [Cutaneotrichosporon oleaginosum]KLT42343.1 hypothetical protein CC85DRAFT_92470 [Cutaneotrichosporon oleaginosum]TXT04163.1 hypothetical protein COLE_07860 [Cutaneotrichosporon oleaginosum]